MIVYTLRQLVKIFNECSPQLDFEIQTFLKVENRVPQNGIYRKILVCHYIDINPTQIISAQKYWCIKPIQIIIKVFRLRQMIDFDET